MGISEDLLLELVKTTSNDEVTSNNDDLLHGTVVEYGGNKYVKLDGSDLLTPVNNTAVIKDQDRVTLTIKNHIATILGNLTSPSASSTDLSELGNTVTEFGTVVAHSLVSDEIQTISAKIDLIKAQLIQSTVITTEELIAINARIDSIKSDYIDTDRLTAIDIDAVNGKFDNLSADLINTYGIETTILDAVNANISFLKSYSAEFTYVSAVKAQVKDLQVNKLSTDSAEINYANIDFANVNLANIGKLFTKSGIIENLIVGEQTITGKLVGVTIIGDLIEAGTLKADRIIVEGEDGLYYKLNINGETVEAEQTDYNSLNGNVITAQSITASKINVTDLSAFNATIGGYHIGSDKLYSGVKQYVENTSRGVYLDDDGQLNFGDSDNYLKFSKEYILTDAQPDDWSTNWTNYYTFNSSNGYTQVSDVTVPIWIANTFYYNTGNYILELSAKSIKFGSNKNLENYTDTNNQNMDTIFKKLAYVEVSSDNNNPYIELGKIGSAFRLKLTNTEMDFLEGTNVIAYVSDQSLMIEKSVIKDNETIGETYYVLTLSQPTDWITNWTNYYTLANDVYSKVTDTTVPTWITNTYYYKNAGFMWKQRENGNMGLSWLGDD